MAWVIENAFLGKRMRRIEQAELTLGLAAGTIVKLFANWYQFVNSMTYPPAPVLRALRIAPVSIVEDAAATIAILRAQPGSTLQASGLPAGLTLNSAQRRITGTVADAAPPTDVTLTETLAGAVGSPMQSTVTIEVTAAPAPPAGDGGGGEPAPEPEPEPEPEPAPTTQTAMKLKGMALPEHEAMTPKALTAAKPAPKKRGRPRKAKPGDCVEVGGKGEYVAKRGRPRKDQTAQLGA